MSRLIQHRLQLLLFLSIAFNVAWGQSTVRGNVKDAGGAGIPYSNVLLLKAADSSLIKGMLTDKAGAFLFSSISEGRYLLVGSHTGFKDLYTDVLLIAPGMKELIVPDLLLQPEEGTLSTVTVTTKKPLFEQKVDRLVINVASSVTAVGSTALDVLERSPGITVDRQNNSLSMGGKNGVVVMLNGKISRMPVSAVVLMLSGMNSNNIEKIELITTPPSNFDAEGNAGYINIVMKENMQFGTNGSFSLSAGYGNGLAVSSGFNFNYRNKKINIYGDHSFSREAVGQEFSFSRSLNQGGKLVESTVDSRREPVTVYNNVRLGIDYQLNKKTILGTVLSAFDRRWTMDAWNLSHVLVQKRLDTVVTIYNHEKHNLHNYSANLNLAHTFSPNERISIDVDYVHYKDNNPVAYQNAYFNGTGQLLYHQDMTSGKKTPISFWVGSLDYSRKFGKKADLEAGLKGTRSEFENSVSVQRKQQNGWETDQELTAVYNLDERILASYASLNVAFTEKTSAKAGLRYEHTTSNLQSATRKNIVDRSYGNVFPTIFIGHKLDSNSTINLSYNKRITRPTFNDMAPFVIFLDPNTFFSGNPALQPSISDGIKADYLYKRLIFSLSYTYEDNPITNFSPKVDPATNRQTLAAENQKSNQVVNVVLALPVKISGWWEMQNNLIGLWQKLDAVYNSAPIQLEQKTFMMQTTQTFTLPQNYTVELSAFFRSAGLFGIYKARAFGAADIGVQKKFTNGSLRLAYQNMFNSLVFRPTIDQPDRNLVVRARLQFEYPILRLTYSHNFGNQKLAGKRDRATAEQERQRVQAN